MMSKKTTVALLALPQSTGSLLYGLFDLFSMVRRDWAFLVDGQQAESPFDVRIVGREAGALAVENGLSIVVQETLDEVPDIACVPELVVTPEEELSGRFAPELEWLGRCHEAGAVLSAACTGALLLAEAGLLRGHEAATHWLYCDRLARYEGVTVRADKALVVSAGGRLVMAGGGTSWQDLGLYLIARYAGVEEALRTAKMSLIDWHHQGQLPFAGMARGGTPTDAVIGDLRSWIAKNYDMPKPVAAMVERSGVKERSLTRRFKQATGMTPIEYVHAQRLEEAKRRLETTSDPIEGIALRVGYEDSSFFGRLFRRKVGLTPAQYRRRFGGLRQTLTTALTRAC